MTRTELLNAGLDRMEVLQTILTEYTVRQLAECEAVWIHEAGKAEFMFTCQSGVTNELLKMWFMTNQDDLDECNGY